MSENHWLIRALTAIREHQQFYDGKFDSASLEFLDLENKGTSIRFRLTDTKESSSFDIILTKDSPHRPGVFASNVLVVNSDQTMTGIIHVSPELQFQSKETQKEELAHEWLELMMGFGSPTDWKEKTSTFTKNWDQLGLPPPWQDRMEFKKVLEIAIPRLLVPPTSLEYIFPLTPASQEHDGSCTLLEFIRDAIVLTPKMFEDLVMTFSEHKHVRQDIVSDRFHDILNNFQS